MHLPGKVTSGQSPLLLATHTPGGLAYSVPGVTVQSSLFCLSRCGQEEEADLWRPGELARTSRGGSGFGGPVPVAAGLLIFFQSEDLGSAQGSGDVILEKGEPGALEEWETVVGEDFSLLYDSYSVDERVDSDSKVCGRGRCASFLG